MRGAGIARLCVLCLMLPALALGELLPPSATLPPGLPASVAAPQAQLPVRLYAPDASALSLKRIAVWEDMLAVVGQKEAGEGGRADALWQIDLVSGACTMLYEARKGVQIVTPVYCRGELYWVEAYEDQPDGWRIRTWNRNRRVAESVRSDPKGRSALMPALSTDGQSLYWYESAERFAQQPPYARLRVTLYQLPPAKKARPVQRNQLTVPVDWLPPHVRRGTHTVGVYSETGWRIAVQPEAGGAAIAEIRLTAMPVEAQGDGRYAVWRQEQSPEDAEKHPLAQQAQAEEDAPSYAEAAGTGIGEQLWMAKLELPEPVQIDTRVETALLREEGVYYVNEGGALCFYSFALGRILRLTGFSDYLPALCVQGERLFTLRAIDDGLEVRYRAAAIDTGALRSGQWPPLE